MGLAQPRLESLVRGAMARKLISIVTPCYDEEESIRECRAAVKAIFADELKDYDHEHIFCDNASTDRTVEMLREMAAEDRSVKVILNARNFGPLRSNFNGVKAASGDAVLLFLPADLQDPPELISQFVALWEEGNEVVYGIRAGREEGFPMFQIRKLYYRILAGSSYLDMPPDVGDFQLVDRKVLAAIKSFNDMAPFLRTMTFECGFRRIGVSYTCRARQSGISKNRLHHLIDQGLSGLISFTSLPMRAALGIGLVIATLAIAFAIVNVILFFTPLGTGVPRGTTLLITALFFFAGVQLFFIGFLGEYVLAIYNQVRHRPLVIERERINFEEGGEAPTGDDAG